MDRPEPIAALAHLALETFPVVMAHVGQALRHEARVNQQQHFHVLRALRQADRSLSELASVSLVRLPTMSRTVDALARRDWVERYHAESDRRTLHVRITDGGKAALAHTEQLAIETVSELLAQLDLQNREALGAALSALSHIMHRRLS